MTAISSVVEVSISTTPQMPSQTGFGTPMILAYHTAYVDRIRTYSQLSEAVADGIPTEGVGVGAYLALAKAFGQNPRPPQVKLGRRTTAFSQSLRIIPTTFAEGEVIRLKFGAGGQTLSQISYEVPGASSVALIIDQLKIQIDALNLDVTTTDNATSLDIDADDDGDLFDIEDLENVTLEDRTAAPADLDDDLALVMGVDDDWYGIGLDSNSKAEIELLADDVQALRKVFFCHNADTAIATAATDDLASNLQDAGYTRTALYYNAAKLLSYTGVAAMAENFPYPPGSSSYAFKELDGVKVDRLSETQRGFVQGKNANVYVSIARTSNTLKGVMPNGEWIDTIVGVDWLQARIEESVFGALRAVRKVPYTDDGVDLIKAAVNGPLQGGIRNKFLAPTPAPIVTAPKVADISVTDKQNRLLPDVTFVAYLAGAIVFVQVSGVVSV